MIALPKFRRGRSGLMERIVTPAMREAVEQAEKEKRDRLTARWREKIRAGEIPDWPKIERMAERDLSGLGGAISDIVEKKHISITVKDKVVAAVQMIAYVEELSDAIPFMLYRDPNRSRVIRFMLGKVI